MRYTSNRIDMDITVKQSELNRHYCIIFIVKSMKITVLYKFYKFQKNCASKKTTQKDHPELREPLVALCIFPSILSVITFSKSCIRR